ncbi:MAG: S41 family peptidase [Pirellulaceae bacterium]|nr:S41 family peptidase [Pirellulaceae bacterium]
MIAKSNLHKRRIFSLIAGFSVGLLHGDLCGQEPPAKKKSTPPPVSAKQDSQTAQQKDKIIIELENRMRKQQEELQLLKLFAESLSEIERSYVQPVNRRRLIEAAIEGMLDELDPYSDFIPQEELAEFQTDIESEYGGIGIRVVKRPDEDYLRVTTPILDSPAYQAGVRGDTWIVKIGEIDAKNFSVTKAIELMQGEIGSTLEVTFRDPENGKDQKLEIARALIQVKTVLGDQRLPNDQWDYFLRSGPSLPAEKIGYIRITNFGRQTGDELKAVMNQLLKDGLQGLILDLRFNPGGLLSEAITISDLFVDKGLIVRTEGRNARPRRWKATQEGTLTGFPIAILVNGRSASASEIVAACLKDADRAVVVGQRTFGKGSVQNMVELENGRSLMKLTTAAYFRPNGQNINRMSNHSEDDIWGVRPSSGYEVKMLPESDLKYRNYRRSRDVIGRRKENQSEVQEFDDLQLKKALEYTRSQINLSASPENNSTPLKQRCP